MYSLEVINAMNEKAVKEQKKEEKEEWFGEVRWSKDDLADALEVKGYPVTEENVNKLLDMVDDHWFTDYMIQAGWEYIYEQINNIDLEG